MQPICLFFVARYSPSLSRTHTRLKDVTVNNIEYKLTQFADDTTLLMNEPQHVRLENEHRENQRDMDRT